MHSVNMALAFRLCRAASGHARDLFDQDYPFTCKQFQTDGRSIFATVLDETNDETLLDLVKKQYVFKQVIKPSLYKGIEYDSDGDAERWFPLQSSRAVVLDPQRNFGKPMLTEVGINTAAIANSYKAEDEDYKRVASIYEIPVAAVESAIRFEHRNVN